MLINKALLLFAFLLLTMLVACENREPLQLGFVAGLSGRVADLGVAGRNGVQLAVEQWNAKGGINGRKINLVVKDDEQNPETVKRVVGELLAQKIELIIGPMTSSMAMEIVPLVNASESLLLSPTVTTTDLLGKDDNFLRVISSTADYGKKSARFQYQQIGARTVAVLYDLNNRSYSESWLREFRREFEVLGGEIVLAEGFHSSKDTVFSPLVRDLLGSKADVILIISNAVDSALICQQVRKVAPEQGIVMSEWASTERFIELAGTAAEGVMVAQFLDRDDNSQRYEQFQNAYRSRFNQEPGFAGVAGYDAASVALEAYALRKSNQSLKQVILDKHSFQGTQQLLEIDRFGDSNRNTFVTVVSDSRFITVE